MGFIFNVVKRLIKTIIKLSLFLALIGTVIVLIPNLPPYTKFTSIEVTPIQPRVGPLAINSALNNAEKLYSGKLLGPEAFQVFKGELYTSLATGEIVKLSPEGHVTFVTTVGQPCSGIIHEHICGRPLGIVIDEKDESLYVADAYHGIWKVNLKTNKKQLLVSPRVEIEKRQPKLFNSLALAKNGDLYWTDSTSDFHLKDGAMSVMTDPSGRLFHYDAAKNQSKVLLDDLWFPNGVVLSPNKDFVVVSESFRARIMKYYISGPKKGQSEIFVDGLPGVPDNSRALPDGSGVLVALYDVFEPERAPLPQLLAAAPLARKLLARAQRLLEIPFEYLNTIYPHIIFEEIVYSIGHFKSVSGLTPSLSGLLQIDWDGNIVAGYYNTDNTLGHISDAIVFNDKLHTGSPHQQDFVGTLPVPPLLKKAFAASKKLEKNEQKAKPIQQAPTKKTEEKPKAQVEEKPKVEKKAKLEKEAPKVAKPVAAASKPPHQEKPAAQQPKPVSQQPKPPAQQPQPTAQQPQPAAQQPQPAAQQPQPAAQQPQPAAQQPQPTAQQPKPTAQQPKPVAQQPKLAAQQTSSAAQQPKPATQQAKPAAQQPPPAAQQPKPAAQQPKPAVQQPAVTKPNAEAKGAPKAHQQAPKAPTPTKPASAAVKPEAAKGPNNSKPKATTKPEVQATPPPTPAEKTTPPTPKKTQTENKNEAPKKAQPAIKQETPKDAEIKPKPIKEEIPSDTAKPTKETLKVIKRDGPAEIHVPNQ